MTVSNRSLLFGIVIALIISAVGTFLSIGSISSLGRIFPSTGFASSGIANISIVIAKEISITTLDSDTINFSGCRPGGVIYSNVSDGNAAGDCEGYVPQAIIVRNTGAFPANVTINATDWGEAHGGSFLDASSDDSWIAFKVTNASSHPLFDGGCSGFYADWTNITNGSMYRGCDLLAPSSVNNSFSIDLAIYIPDTVQSGDEELDFVIWGYQV